MRVWIYRWPNGDSSFVWAESRIRAAEILDEVGRAETEHMIALTFPGSIHCALGDDGRLEYEGVSERVSAKLGDLYPVIEALLMREVDGEKIKPEQMAEAVDIERKRVDYDVSLALTPEGRKIQERMDLAGAVADKWAFESTQVKGPTQ